MTGLMTLKLRTKPSPPSLQLNSHSPKPQPSQPRPQGDSKPHPSIQQLNKTHLKILRKIRERSKSKFNGVCRKPDCNQPIRVRHGSTGPEKQETRNLFQQRAARENRIYPTIGTVVKPFKNKVPKSFPVGANFAISSSSSSPICGNDPEMSKIKSRGQTRSLPNVSMIRGENLQSGNLNNKKLGSTEGLSETSPIGPIDREGSRIGLSQGGLSTEPLLAQGSLPRFSRRLYNRSHSKPNLETSRLLRDKLWIP